MNWKCRVGLLAAATFIGVVMILAQVSASDVIPVKIEGEMIYQDGQYLFAVKKIVVLSEACEEIKGSNYRRSYSLDPKDVKVAVAFEGDALKTLEKCRVESLPSKK